ncbi:hypothetical protein OKW21_005229 [Catalinimonas alkaloidigena]|uniref:alginate O-acetyltransferase AlgX-related protein n=1 Tax=Catalinimonas alkaloidigena TaxID=1075417 RepID=UPI0024051EE8|nr:hypothetical protein [Catalinimonas alkaloidigena]MDF9799966.1 hypothetical protein [Catalinimonas alkaloidigena]
MVRRAETGIYLFSVLEFKMKRFIQKTTLFLIPFVVMLAVTKLFYSKNQGDLSRVGYIPTDKSYREKFREEYSQPLKFTNLSEANLSKKNKYSVLTIGDSFSQQSQIGYQNYLAQYDSISVINFDQRVKKNPISVVYGVLNGNLLDSIEVNYIILQSVERHFVERGNEIETNYIFQFKNNKDSSAREKQSMPQTDPQNFPPAEIVKFPLFNILYHLDDNAFFSKVLKVKVDSTLFSGRFQKELLFYEEDLLMTEVNNRKELVVKLNRELNSLGEKLSQKGIMLIVLPAPDKFDVYYNHIVNNEKYTKPKFFEHMQEMQKNYHFIDSRKILSEAINKNKDVYFFDDTHWSPLSSQLIAKELAQIIK